MNTSSIILGLIMIALFIGPFLLIGLFNKRKKKNDQKKQQE